MQLKPKKYLSHKVLPKNVGDIMNSPGKFLTETQLAEVFGLNIKKAIIKAAELNFSRIPVKNTRYYSKKQVQAYLNK